MNCHHMGCEGSEAEPLVFRALFGGFVGVYGGIWYLESGSVREVLLQGVSISKFARVAELADALASGASARKGVGVQVPPRARE